MSTSFKDMLNETKSFGNHLVDFEYILVDVNSYSKQELQNLANAISIIVMLDQKVVAEDKEEFQKRFNEITKMKHKLPVEKFQLILEWLQEVFRKRFAENVQENIMEIIKELKEGENMTYAIERLFDNIQNEGKEEGREEEKIKNAKNLLDLLPDEIIAERLELSIEKVRALRKELAN